MVEAGPWIDQEDGLAGADLADGADDGVDEGQTPGAAAAGYEGGFLGGLEVVEIEDLGGGSPPGGGYRIFQDDWR